MATTEEARLRARSSAALAEGDTDAAGYYADCAYDLERERMRMEAYDAFVALDSAWPDAATELLTQLNGSEGPTATH